MKKAVWRQWVIITAKQKTVNNLKRNLRETFRTNALNNPDSLSLDKRCSYSAADSRNYTSWSPIHSYKTKYSYMAPGAPLSWRNDNRDKIFFEWKKDFHRRSKLSELLNIKIPRMMMRHAINSIKEFANWKLKENESKLKNKYYIEQQIILGAQRRTIIKLILK